LPLTENVFHAFHAINGVPRGGGIADATDTSMPAVAAMGHQEINGAMELSFHRFSPVFFLGQ